MSFTDGGYIPRKEISKSSGVAERLTIPVSAVARLSARNPRRACEAREGGKNRGDAVRFLIDQGYARVSEAPAKYVKRGT